MIRYAFVSEGTRQQRGENRGVRKAGKHWPYNNSHFGIIFARPLIASGCGGYLEVLRRMMNY